MIKFLLNFLPTKYLVLAGIILSVSAGFYAGYRFTKSFYQDEVIKAYEEAEQARLEDEEWNAEVERRYLEATQQVRVETREIIKKASGYIGDGCRLNDDGLRDINAFITSQNQ